MKNMLFKFTVNGILIKEVSISVDNPDFLLNHDDIGKDFEEWLEIYLNV